MFTKYIVPALCASNLLGVEASSRHRHMHKRDVVYAATETDIVTDYVTVTVVEGQQPTAASSSTSQLQAVTAVKPSAAESPADSPETSTPVVAPAPTTEAAATTPTTLATAVKTEGSPAAQAVEPTTPTTAATTPKASTPTTAAAAAATSASSSTGGKRGLAYNNPSLVTTIVNAASGKFSWCYDWGFSAAGLTANIPYIPMLWGPTHYNSAWDTAAKAAIADGTEALLSFNECDNAGQCNLSPGDAANYHKQYLGPYSGQIKVGAPSITSSTDAGEGLDWLSQFMTACNGECPIDFCNLHWYGPGGEDGAVEFLNYLSQAHATCGKNIWVTEFAAISGDEDAFMKYALNQLDTNSTLSFVEKYSYFYLDGVLVSGTTALSALGETYATSS